MITLQKVYGNSIFQVLREKMQIQVRSQNAFYVLAMNAQVNAIQRAACVSVVTLEVLGITVKIVSLMWLVHIAMFAPMDFMDLLRTTRTANVSIQNTTICH